MKCIVPLLLVVVPFVIGCEPPAEDAVDVSVELDSLETKIVWLKYRLAQLEWRELTGQPVDSQRFYRRAWREVCGDMAALERLQRHAGKLSDADEKRRHRIITSLLAKGAVESSPHIAALRDSLLAVMRDSGLGSGGDRGSAGDLSATLRTMDDRVARERAWLAWAGPGSQAAAGVERLLRFRNQQAVRLRYNNYAALALAADSIESSWLLALLDSLEEVTAEPYRAAVARRAAAIGRSELEPWDLAWIGSRQVGILDRYFPVDSQISFLKSALTSCGIDIEKQPIYWDVTAFDDRPGLVRACIVRPGHDQRLRANLRPGFATQADLAFQTGIALQAAFVSRREPLFAYLIDDAWRRTAGLIFEEIVNQPEFLVNTAGVPPQAAAAFRKTQIDQAVIDWRIMLAEARFEYEAYVNANRDLDKLWWDTCNRLLGLPRHDQLSPWAAATDLVRNPLASIDRVLAGLAAAQTLNFLTAHNSTLMDSQTRSFLVQHYFRYGGSADWRRLISHATEGELSHRALVDWLAAEAFEY